LHSFAPKAVQSLFDSRGTILKKYQNPLCKRLRKDVHKKHIKIIPNPFLNESPDMEKINGAGATFFPLISILKKEFIGPKY